MEISGSGFQAGVATQAQQMTKDVNNSQLVTQTIEHLNTNPDGSRNADHAFQTSVLQAGAIGKGGNLNIMA